MNETSISSMCTYTTLNFLLVSVVFLGQTQKTFELLNKSDHYLISLIRSKTRKMWLYVTGVYYNKNNFILKMLIKYYIWFILSILSFFYKRCHKKKFIYNQLNAWTQQFTIWLRREVKHQTWIYTNSNGNKCLFVMYQIKFTCT